MEIETRFRKIHENRSRNKDSFSFGSVNSLDYGVYLTGIDIGGTPERDVSFVSVAGRNGELMIDNKCWKNIDIIYRCAIATDFSAQFDWFKNALLSKSGYHRLTDTIYDDVFRMGVLKQPFSVEAIRLNRTGTFDATFYCKPQRFLITGEIPQLFKHPGDLRNTGFPALPLVRVYGSGDGSVTISGVTVHLFAMEDAVTLDCEIQDAYRDRGGILENWNGKIYAPEFPVLQPGINEISWTGGVDHIEIIPRWWTL